MIAPTMALIDRKIRKDNQERIRLGLTRLEWMRRKEEEQYPNAVRATCVNCGYEMLRGYLSCHSCGHDFRVKVKLGPWIPFEMREELDKIAEEKWHNWFMNVEIPRLIAERQGTDDQD